jgi:hypothetical protein
MEWSDQTPEVRRTKYKVLLAEVRADQHLNPTKWAEVQWFERIQSAREASSRLKHLYPGFEFRSQIDQETGMGVLYARYTVEW